MLSKLKHWSDVQNEVELDESIDQEKFHPMAQEVHAASFSHAVDPN